MPNKVVLTGSYDFGEAPVALMDVHNKGVDNLWLQKRASVLIPELDGYKAASGRTPLHLIALGTTETYGPNANADGFNRYWQEKNGHTFLTDGHVYKEHVNKDPKKASGEVKIAKFNPKMDRTELVIEVDNNKWSDELQKVASGKDIFFSMACVLNPDYPVLTDRGYIPIAEVKVGDRVLTHKGRWRGVKALNRRRYTGKVVEFCLNGLPLPVVLTADHPMFGAIFDGSDDPTARRAKVRRHHESQACFDKNPPAWYHAEHFGKDDRIYYQPVTPPDGFAALDDEDLATLLGYYTAEGSLNFNGEKACTVNLHCNMADSLVRRIPEIIARRFPSVTCTAGAHRTSVVGMVIRVHSTQIAEYVKRVVGSGVWNKQVPFELYGAKPEVQLAYVGAWVDGDGWADKKGAHVSTCNINLALQLRDLLAVVGIPSSIYTIDHSACATSGHENTGIEYTVNISWLEAPRLSLYSEKIREYSEVPPNLSREKPASLRRTVDGRYSYRIKKVKTYNVSETLTYNFEVEEDESYSLAGLISHNCKVPYDVCSICDNKARSRIEYCGCMKKFAGQILNDGRRVYVDNPHPTWFDISGVYRPADKIAYIMGCPCMEKGGAMVKSGSETPILGVDLYDALYPTFRKQSHSLDVPSLYAPMKRRILSKLAALEKEIELVAPADENIKNLSSAFSDTLPIEPFGDLFKDCKGEVISKLASMRIILPLRTFLDLVGAEIEPEQVEECLPGIFSELDEEDDCIADSGTYDPGGFNILPQSFLSALPDLFEEGSFADEPTRRRISITIIRKTPAKSLRGPVKIRTIKSAGHAEAKLWAREYANYKLAQLAALHDDGIREKDAKMAVLQNYVRTSKE